MRRYSGKDKVVESFLKFKGFRNRDEFVHMITSVDISTKDSLSDFIKWISRDGTREGLLRLIDN